MEKEEINSPKGFLTSSSGSLSDQEDYSFGFIVVSVPSQCFKPCTFLYGSYL